MVVPSLVVTVVQGASANGIAILHTQDRHSYGDCLAASAPRDLITVACAAGPRSDTLGVRKEIGLV